MNFLHICIVRAQGLVILISWFTVLYGIGAKIWLYFIANSPLDMGANSEIFHENLIIKSIKSHYNFLSSLCGPHSNYQNINILYSQGCKNTNNQDLDMVQYSDGQVLDALKGLKLACGTYGQQTHVITSNSLYPLN